MTARRVSIAIAACWTVATAAWLGSVAIRDARAARRARKVLALEVARFVGRAISLGANLDSAAAEAGRRYGADVSACLAAPASGRLPRGTCPADRLALARVTDAPSSAGPVSWAPLKDSDDWDVVGLVAVIPRHAATLQRSGVAARFGPPAFLALAAVLLAVRSRRATPLHRARTAAAWAFLGLPLAHLIVFSMGPVLFTIALSFHRWDLVTDSREFVGVANFRALAQDASFWITVRNTALYVLYVPATMALALGLALWLDRSGRAARWVRAVVFLPYVSSVVAVALAWQWLFNADHGLLNAALATLGIRGPDWLGSPSTALLALIGVTVWMQVGYQMVVFLAGLQGIPRQYLEAALVDGAGAWPRFRHITLPLLRPVILFVLVTGVVSGFQVFTLVYMMTEGGPLHATDVVVYRIYQTAWEFLRFGEASAMAVVLLLLLLLFTAVQFRLLGRRTELA